MSSTINHPLDVGTTITYYRREGCKQRNRLSTGRVRAVFKNGDHYVYRLVGVSVLVKEHNIVGAQ